MLDTKLVLASKSPRRFELLQQAGFDFKVVTKEVNEQYPDHLKVDEIPVYLAALKAKSVLKEVANGEIIVAADTIVVKGEQVYGKPKDRGEAIEILKGLSGTAHDVITGVCLLSADQEKQFSVSTKVIFNALTDEEVNYYVDRYQPYDKAGAYAIQEWIGLIGIKRIDGCYFNVVGLPVSKLYEELKNF